MTKKLKVYLLIILGAVGMACALAGCKVGRAEREEELKDYPIHVTYYANGGNFNGSTSLTVRELYFKPGETGAVPFYDIAEDTGDMKVAQDDYDLVGWYLAATYTEGEHKGEIIYKYTPNGSGTSVSVYPVYNEKGKPVKDNSDRPYFAREGVDEKISEKDVRVEASSTKVDSTRWVSDGENLVVCAVWRPSLRVEYILLCDEGAEYHDASDNVYKNGSSLTSVSFGKRDTATPTTETPLALKDATFVHTYTDESKGTLMKELNRSDATVDAEGNPVIYVYSWYLSGANWNIVESVSSAVAMLSGLASTNKYYVMNDVNLNGATVTIKNTPESGIVGICRATIEGKGHTISNFKVAPSEASVSSVGRYSLFGSIGKEANIDDLKLDNITIELSGRRGAQITFYAICTDMAEDATVTKLAISNVTATVTIPSAANTFVANADKINDGTCWLFGGEDTDEAFLAKHPGITVSGENKAEVKVTGAVA